MLHGPTTLSTNTISTTGTTTCCSPTCSCPNCGYQFEQSFIGVRVSEDHYAPMFDMDKVPIIRPRASFARPQSARVPVWAIPLRRNGFNRPGRTLRHRGGFRNFHKMD